MPRAALAGPEEGRANPSSILSSAVEKPRRAATGFSLVIGQPGPSRVPPRAKAAGAEAEEAAAAAEEEEEAAVAAAGGAEQAAAAEPSDRNCRSARPAQNGCAGPHHIRCHRPWPCPGFRR